MDCGKSGSEDIDANVNGINITANPNVYDDYAYDDDGETWIKDLSIPRLREGVERFFITDINNPASGTTGQSALFIMMDAWATADSRSPDRPNSDASGGMGTFNHIPGGCNVLYMDGHVEFVRYGTGAPAWTAADNSWANNRHTLIGGIGGMG